MPSFLTRLDLYSIGRNVILTKARRIEPDTVDRLGSDANIFIGSVSFMAAAVSRQLAKGLGAQSLRNALNDDLDRWLWDRYQETRKTAAAASVTLEFVRPNANAGIGEIPDKTKILTTTGIEYVTTTSASFGASQLLATAQARAVNAGKTFQVGRNFLRRFERQDQLFDPTITVNNPQPAAGGEDREDDPTVKDRMRDFWPTLRRGTKGAIEFGARSIPGIASASAREVLTANATPARVVELLIADSSGVASESLAAAVYTGLDEYRACGIAVIPSLSVPQIVPVRLRLAFLAGVETSTLTLIVRAAVSEFINSLGANQTLVRADLFSVMSRYKARGLVVSETSIVEPAGDVIPAAGRTLRTTLANVTTI